MDRGFAVRTCAEKTHRQLARRAKTVDSPDFVASMTVRSIEKYSLTYHVGYRDAVDRIECDHG